MLIMAYYSRFSPLQPKILKPMEKICVQFHKILNYVHVCMNKNGSDYNLIHYLVASWNRFDDYKKPISSFLWVIFLIKNSFYYCNEKLFHANESLIFYILTPTTQNLDLGSNILCLPFPMTLNYLYVNYNLNDYN